MDRVGDGDVVDDQLRTRSLRYAKESHLILTLRNWIASADVTSNICVVGAMGGGGSGSQLTLLHCDALMTDTLSDKQFGIKDFPKLASEIITSLRRRVTTLFDMTGVSMPLPSTIFVDGGVMHKPQLTTTPIACTVDVVDAARDAAYYYNAALRHVFASASATAPATIKKAKEIVQQLSSLTTDLHTAMYLLCGTPPRATELLNASLGSTLPGGRMSTFFAMPREGIRMSGLSGGIDVEPIAIGDDLEQSSIWARSLLHCTELSDDYKTELFVWSQSAKQAASRAESKTGAQDALESTASVRMLPPQLTDILKLYMHCFRHLHESLVVLAQLGRESNATDERRAGMFT